jgi:hypothetical protein
MESRMYGMRFFGFKSTNYGISSLGTVVQKKDTSSIGAKCTTSTSDFIWKRRYGGFRITTTILFREPFCKPRWRCMIAV